MDLLSLLRILLHSLSSQTRYFHVIIYLVIGLPDERPGGLVLTLLFALSTGSVALVLGIGYAIVCVIFKQLGMILQIVFAFFRSVPIVMFVFLVANLSGLAVHYSGMLALCLYSLGHVGEILRSFMLVYPAILHEQSNILGIGPYEELMTLRLPWSLRYSWDALCTHWISLLKDTGALVVLGIGELTAVARALGEQSASTQDWLVVFATASFLYLMATLGLIKTMGVLRHVFFPPIS
jgi:ABC-type amino acid transport system permease subunit